VTVWDGKVLGTKTVEVKRAGSQSVTVTGASGLLAVAFEAKKGGTASSIARLSR
jgi:hypothetical protein